MIVACNSEMNGLYLCEELDFEAYSSPYSVVASIHVVADCQYNLPKKGGKTTVSIA